MEVEGPGLSMSIGTPVVVVVGFGFLLAAAAAIASSAFDLEPALPSAAAVLIVKGRNGGRILMCGLRTLERLKKW